MDKAPKFTFKNYLKELKKSWVLLVVFLVIGAAAGVFYSFKDSGTPAPTVNTFTAEIAVHNPKANVTAQASPYNLVVGILNSKKLLLEANSSLKEDEVPSYTVAEDKRGVLVLRIATDSEEKAKKFSTTLFENAGKMISIVYGTADDYKFTLLKEAEGINTTVETKSTKSRIISMAVITLGALALGLLIIFIRFDFRATK